MNSSRQIKTPSWRANKLKRSDLPDSFFDLIPQAGMHVGEFARMEPQPNAIWDLMISSQGRVFISLCSELAARRAAMLYEYQTEEHCFKFCFDVARHVMPLAGAIVPSKIHSSMSEMEDGRIIMATHTTVAAEGHKAWLFPQYFDHIWEGYQGSNLLIYDPVSGVVENLGVPAPRDSIYGGCYDPKHQAYYFSTYLRGHFYRYDLERRRVTDLGQGAEFGTFRLARGPDGNIYFSTRSGWLCRINVDTGKIEHLDGQLHGPMSVCICGPDGRLYITANGKNYVYAYDIKANRFDLLGQLFPRPVIPKLEPGCIMSMAFDRNGRLWYGYGTTGFCQLCRLARCDILHGGEPEDIGMLSSEKRNAACISELHIHDDTLYIADTNHCEDPPALVVIDLAKMEGGLRAPRKRCQDPLAYYLLEDGLELCDGLKDRLEEFDAGYSHSFVDHFEAIGKLPYFVRAAKVEVVPLWRKIPVEESSVRIIRWDPDGHVRGLSGGNVLWKFDIADGILLSVESTSTDVLKEMMPVDLSRVFADICLPSAPGRQHLAKAACAVPWHKGCQLVGTLDGRLATVDLANKKTCSLGAVVACGPVRQIVTNLERNRAFGVAGDPRGVGIVFYYDDETGLRELGWVGGEYQSLVNSVGNSSEPCCLALSPDERSLAVGVADRLGCVYLFHNVQI